jgi:hypothetical protein
MAAIRSRRESGSRNLLDPVAQEKAHSSFTVVGCRNENPTVMELVKPTHQTSLDDGSVINWSGVNPDGGYTYSGSWNRQ